MFFLEKGKSFGHSGVEFWGFNNAFAEFHVNGGYKKVFQKHDYVFIIMVFVWDVVRSMG